MENESRTDTTVSESGLLQEHRKSYGIARIAGGLFLVYTICVFVIGIAVGITWRAL